jgi:hypothetical protein
MAKQRQSATSEGVNRKNRKRNDEGEPYEQVLHVQGASAKQRATVAGQAQPAEILSGFQRMDEETTTYLTEVKAHLETLDDGEEISLLVWPYLVPLLHKHKVYSQLPHRHRGFVAVYFKPVDLAQKTL